MSNWKERVVTEKAELDEKIDKLDEFLKSGAWCICVDQKGLLESQLDVMKAYSHILAKRLAPAEGSG